MSIVPVNLNGHFVAILQHRDAGARVAADVEGFVLREGDRGAMFHGILGHFLAVHGEHALPALAQAWFIGLVVEDDGVLAGAQRRPCPHRALEVEQVVEEHRLAPANAHHASGKHRDHQKCGEYHDRVAHAHFQA